MNNNLKLLHEILGISEPEHSLTEHFNVFFTRLNPSSSFVQKASRIHNAIRDLIEDAYGPAAVIAPKTLLQGSYKQDTATYNINDIDIVALCQLWFPAASGGYGNGSSKSYSRDEIFEIIASALRRNSDYASKLRYNKDSMCIKLELDIKVEILPVVFSAGNFDPAVEPFKLYRPHKSAWDDGYARYHQKHLSAKNGVLRADGNFIPCIKVLKHLRSRFYLDAVSFHIECLLYSMPDHCFSGSPARYINEVLSYIASTSAEDWYKKVLNTPCGERDIFSSDEWNARSWIEFHNQVKQWAEISSLAVKATPKSNAIKAWQLLLGSDFFPQSA